MKKKRIANGIVENEVANALIVSRDYTASEIKRIVEKELKKKGYNYRFTERTYLNIKKRLLPNIGPEPIDLPWTIGSCVKYGIPADVIPLLIEEQKLNSGEQLHLILSQYDKEYEETVDPRLTVRQAIWFARLYSSIERLIDSAEPDASPLQRLGYHSFIAEHYAKRERISQVLGEDHPDTSDLDKLYFFSVKLDITEGWLRSHFPEKYNKAQQDLKNFAPLTKEVCESVLGELTIEEVDLFNEWRRIQYLIQVHPSHGSQALDVYFEEHPQMKPLTEKWLKWSSGVKKDEGWWSIKSIRTIKKEDGEK